MKFGIRIPGLTLSPALAHPWDAAMTPDDIVRVARRADELGYDWLSVSDHVAIPRHMVQTMGARWPEALSTAAFLAGVTKRIRIVTNILVVPYRNPIVAAKAVATLDFLSGGRLTLGVGAGHVAEEFATLNVPFGERGAITDEYLRAMKELWTSERPSFRGRFVQFQDVAFEPKPVQKPHPPIWVGGQGGALPSMRRAATLGDGWAPWIIPLRQVAEGLQYIRQQPGFQDRPRPFDVVIPMERYPVEAGTDRPAGKPRLLGSRDEMVQRIARLKAAGVTVTRAGFGQVASLEEYLDRLEWFAQEVIPASRE